MLIYPQDAIFSLCQVQLISRCTFVFISTSEAWFRSLCYERARTPRTHLHTHVRCTPLFGINILSTQMCMYREMKCRKKGGRLLESTHECGEGIIIVDGANNLILELSYGLGRSRAFLLNGPIAFSFHGKVRNNIGRIRRTVWQGDASLYYVSFEGVGRVFVRTLFLLAINRFPKN